jgi:hypothetical protein
MKKIVEKNALPRRTREMLYAPMNATTRVIGTTQSMYWAVRSSDDQKAELFSRFL